LVLLFTLRHIYLLSFGSTVVFQQVFDPGLIAFVVAIAPTDAGSSHVPTAAKALIEGLVDFVHGSGVFGYAGEDVFFYVVPQLCPTRPVGPYRQQSSLVSVARFAPPSLRQFNQIAIAYKLVT
jgi:hypothetical protein